MKRNFCSQCSRLFLKYFPRSLKGIISYLLKGQHYIHRESGCWETPYPEEQGHPWHSDPPSQTRVSQQHATELTTHLAALSPSHKLSLRPKGVTNIPQNHPTAQATNKPDSQAKSRSTPHSQPEGKHNQAQKSTHNHWFNPRKFPNSHVPWPSSLFRDKTIRSVWYWQLRVGHEEVRLCGHFWGYQRYHQKWSHRRDPVWRDMWYSERFVRKI